MTEKLIETFGEQLNEVKLIPSSGGVFEVEVDGQLLFSKKALKRHTTFEEIRERVEEHLRVSTG